MRPLATSDVHGRPPGDQTPLTPPPQHSFQSLLPAAVGSVGPVAVRRSPETPRDWQPSSCRPGGDTEALSPTSPPPPCPAPSLAASSGVNSHAEGIPTCSAQWPIADSRGVPPSWPALEHFCQPRSPHHAPTAPISQAPGNYWSLSPCSVDLPDLDVLYDWGHNTQQFASR